MSHVVLHLLDHERHLHRSVPLGLADAVFASLSADPRTVPELQEAATRFVQPLPGRRLFESWSEGTARSPAEAPQCYIDLPGRLVIWNREGGLPTHHGCVVYQDSGQGPRFRIWFRVAEQWAVSGDVAQWESQVQARRAELSRQPEIDARTVLYDRVVEYLAEQCFAERRSAKRKVRRARRDQQNGSPTSIRREQIRSVVREIHARWLTTARPDLAGRSPRSVLLAHRELINYDLHGRGEQWTLTGQCPPGVARSSHAYRFGGFGSHECIMYYDMVRYLLNKCWQRVLARRSSDPGQETQRLTEEKEAWLSRPSEDLAGTLSPADVIDRERRRLPLAVTGEAAMLDCDCPLCQLMADDGPTFVHLDACHLDQDFAFSFFETEEEYERELGMKLEPWEELERPLVEPLDGSPVPAATIGSGSLGRGAMLAKPVMSNEIRLINIAACLADLGADLKSNQRMEPYVKALNRQFGNVREVLRQKSEALLVPAIDRLCSELSDVSQACPRLAPRCGALQDELNRFAQKV